MKDMDVSLLFISLGKLFKRFHTTVFIIVTVTGLAYSVVLLSDLVAKASEGVGGIATPSTINFDTETMTRLKALHTSSDIPNIVLPEGRTNPFGE